ncbi:MAG: hypothetical protein ACQEP8_05605 [Chlamydiota bacterium]
MIEESSEVITSKITTQVDSTAVTEQTAEQAPSTPTEDKAANKVFVSNMQELKKASKKVYDATIDGITKTILKDMKESQERLKKIRSTYS